jgi:hypothetical protein
MSIPNEIPGQGQDTPRGQGALETGRWSNSQRFMFWSKLGVLIAPTILVLTFFLTTCGGVKAIGGQTAEKAEEQHRQMKVEEEAQRLLLKADFDAKIKAAEDRMTQQRIESENRYNDGMREVRKSVDSLSQRIDRVLDRSGRKP